MKKYRCTVCEWVYDPAVGDPDGGIAPGTQFEEIPEDWVCPVCGVGVNIISCAPGGGYVAASGTSMATPFVTGGARTQAVSSE